MAPRRRQRDLKIVNATGWRHVGVNAEPNLNLTKGLVTNYGEGGGRGAREVLALRKGGGAENVLAILKGGGAHKKFWGSFYVVA